MMNIYKDSETVEKRLVKINKEIYYLDQFINNLGDQMKIEGEILYTGDTGHWNFHIVPDKEAKYKNGKTLSDWMHERLMSIVCNFTKCKITHRRGGYESGTFNIGDSELKWACKKGSETHTWNHKWIEVHDEKYEYLLLPLRLWCDKANHVNCNFGQIQFMYYPYYPITDGQKIDEQINKFYTGERTEKGKPIYTFEMMYPTSAADGDKCDKTIVGSRHCVYNPEVLTIKSEPDVIADAFVKFIKANQGECA